MSSISQPFTHAPAPQPIACKPRARPVAAVRSHAVLLAIHRQQHWVVIDEYDVAWLVYIPADCRQ